MKKNTLYYGDCLEVMKDWPDSAVDLIYLDPPFNSKVNYNILFGTGKAGEEETDLAQLTAFTDTWQWDEDAQRRVELIQSAVSHPAHAAITAFSVLYPNGSDMLSYLSYMAERIAEMHRLLKPTGSIYLHCDPTASHYLKMIMDDVFDGKNFRNEIVWCYHGPGSPNMRQFNRKTDNIFWYSKGDTWIFNKDAVRIPYSDPNQTLRRAMSTTRSFTQQEAEQNRQRGKVPENWWEIRIAARSKKEYLGYPTQKPLALLERIIKASSNEGDVVLDPFCGCGTTIEAAHILKRDWIGIDISTYAIEVIRRERMNNLTIPLEGVPKDIKAAGYFARNKPFDFEKWAVTRIPGFAPNTVQVGDRGIDGRALIHGAGKNKGLCIAQVKGGTPQVDSLKALSNEISRGKAEMGVFITLRRWNTPTVRECIAEAGSLEIGANRYNRLVMYSIEEYFHNIPARLPPLAHPRTGLPFQRDVLDLQDT